VQQKEVEKKADSRASGDKKQYLDSGIRYSCRFDISIDSEKEFQVVRRLTGAKGCNMKRIIELCGRNANSKDKDAEIYGDAGDDNSGLSKDQDGMA
jgi:hypothetical protein